METVENRNFWGPLFVGSVWKKPASCGKKVEAVGNLLVRANSPGVFPLFHILGLEPLWKLWKKGIKTSLECSGAPIGPVDINSDVVECSQSHERTPGFP